MPRFEVKTPVLRDGKRFEPGDKIDLDKKEAEAMGSDVLKGLPEKEDQQG